MDQKKGFYYVHLLVQNYYSIPRSAGSMRRAIHILVTTQPKSLGDLIQQVPVDIADHRKQD